MRDTQHPYIIIHRDCNKAQVSRYKCLYPDIYDSSNSGYGNVHPFVVKDDDNYARIGRS